MKRKYDFAVELKVSGDTIEDVIKGYKKAALEFLDYLETQLKEEKEEKSEN